VIQQKKREHGIRDTEYQNQDNGCQHRIAVPIQQDDAAPVGSAPHVAAPAVAKKRPHTGQSLPASVRAPATHCRVRLIHVSKLIIPAFFARCSRLDQNRPQLNFFSELAIKSKERCLGAGGFSVTIRLKELH
jgi:hypothetical protein